MSTKLMNPKEAIEKSDKILLKEKLESSIKNNRYYYYTCAIVWIILALIAWTTKDPWLLADSFVLLICTVNFNITYKIDNARLENLVHK